ncbi:MAG: hypothetical protein IJW57_12650 [Spirochaetaceae bacterium]|nr:hypothetical protein [Spirochaetaceae bacterium]MBQ7368055.1 hypothetical protein [Spirochaetaceae bacterium]
MSYDVLEKQINLLTTEQQQEVFDFIHFLISKNQGLISDFSGVPELLNVSVSSAERISDESLEKKKLLRTLVGIIPQDADENLLREERLARQ